MDQVKMEDVKDLPPSSQMTISTFSATIMGQDVSYQVTKLGEDHLYIWIGSAEARLNDLSFAREIPHDKFDPVTTQIFGSISDSTSSSIAAHLTKKTKKGVYVSYNLPSTDAMIVREVESRLVEEMLVAPLNF